MHENNVICQWRICRLYFIYISMKHHDFINSKFPMSEFRPTSRKGGKLILYIRHANLVVNIWKLIWLASIWNIHKDLYHCDRYQPVHWRHNGRDVGSNHQPHDCSLSLYSGADERIHQSSASLAFVWEFTGDRWISPHKRASNADYVSIWWRHHAWA